MKTQHTPTPWPKITFNLGHESLFRWTIQFEDKNTGKIRLVIAWVNREDDAEFIVRAVNSHEALLEAAKKSRILVGQFDGEDNVAMRLHTELDKAIAQAEGEVPK